MSRMHLLDLTLASLAENLALDEALLLHAEAGGPEVLRIWEWPHPAVVLGAAGRIADDVDEPACLADDVPILRRSTGGGTVLLGAGCLLFSLILRFDRDPALGDLHASYRFILDKIQVGIAATIGDASPTLQGSSDITLDRRKFSGNAQQRKRTHLLHHGTLLYAFDMATIGRYLKAPPRQPGYRQNRTHSDFLTNLSLTSSTLREMLKNSWSVTKVLIDWPASAVKELAVEKYLTSEWIRRR